MSSPPENVSSPVEESAHPTRLAAPAADGRAPAAAADRPSPLLRLYPALGQPAFRVLWLGMLPASLAWQMGTVVSPYAAFALTGSAAVLGVVSLASGLPLVLLSLVGGVAADRLPRRLVLVGTQTTFGLAAAALAGLALAGVLDVSHLIVGSLVQGAALSFNMPARQAYIAVLVERRNLPSAVALNNAGMNFCRVAGPSLAGVLLAWPAAGIGGGYLAMTALYALVLVTLIRLPADPRPSPDETARRVSGLAQMVEGLRYVSSSPTLLALMGLGFVAVFFGLPYQALMPVFAERVFDVGAAGLGMLMAATGGGALVGAVGVAALGRFPRPAALQLGLGVAFGLALVGFALSPSFTVALVLLMLVGFLSASFNGLNHMLLMANADPRLYGRVMSIYLLTFAAMPLGAMPMGWLADRLGAPSTIALAGLVVAGSVAGVAALFPRYRGIGWGMVPGRSAARAAARSHTGSTRRD